MVRCPYKKRCSKFKGAIRKEQINDLLSPTAMEALVRTSIDISEK